MKTQTKYQQAKQALKDIAKEAKDFCRNDKPYIRMCINDNVHYISKDYDLSDYQRNLLSNYACTLHPKD